MHLRLLYETGRYRISFDHARTARKEDSTQVLFVIRVFVLVCSRGGSRKTHSIDLRCNFEIAANNGRSSHGYNGASVHHHTSPSRFLLTSVTVPERSHACPKSEHLHPVSLKAGVVRADLTTG